MKDYDLTYFRSHFQKRVLVLKVEISMLERQKNCFCPVGYPRDGY